MKIADIEKPTSEEIAAIANYIQANSVAGIDMTKEGDTTSYSATVDAGEYIVLVTQAGSTVYNPAVVSVNVTDANDLSSVTAGAVDMASRFVAGDTAYLKSSESGMTKSIVGSSEGNENGDTVAVGDTVNFEISNMNFPSYSKDYKDGSVFYRVSDKLDSASFDAITSLKVLVDNAEVAAADDTYTVTYDADNKGFVVAFADSYIRANEGKAVKVTYSSKLATGAGLNFAENKNVAKLAYANDPTKDTGYDETTNPGHEEQEVTYHYTFGIDADIDGQGSDTVNEETHEFNKVTEAGQTYTEKISTVTSKKTMASPKALAGAEFTLYSDEAMENVVKTATSDANGHVQITGLDEGTYYLKETNAPANYTLNDTKFKVEIAANLDGTDGHLTDYTVKFFTKNSAGTWAAAGTSAYVATSTIDAATGAVTNSEITKTVTPTEVVDTKLAGLPNTGANTAIAFTVFGLAGGLAIAFKKSKNA